MRELYRNRLGLQRLLTFLMATVILLSALIPAGSAQEESAQKSTEPTASTESDEEETRMNALQIVSEQLMAQGFPASYAAQLAPLQLSHPTWHFEVLNVPESWDYVLKMEVDDNPARNLISAGAAYTPYRHPTNASLYDTGWYQASRETVSYFMDPRNFCNETDIFQFYCFTGTGAGNADMAVAVEAVLAGSFMQDCVLENGKTYAENFIEIGETVGISPLYLAVKARQEQGGYGSFTSTGDAGQLLTSWQAAGEQGSQGHDAAQLAMLDGYYNIFNINAAGTGRFRVLYGAMQRALQGSPDMAGEWGGAAWDTVWKSIYGGAETIKKNYANNDQNTLYLQKFNVSPHASRRFWGQYMQNVVGALSEGRSLFHAFDSAGALGGVCTFRIPVYAEMPEQICTDPARGTSAYGGVATATLQWSGEVTVGEGSAEIGAQVALLDMEQTQYTEQLLEIRLSANVPLGDCAISLVMKNGSLCDAPRADKIGGRQENEESIFEMSLCLPEDAQAGDSLVYCISAAMAVGESYRCRHLPVAFVTVTVEEAPCVSLTVWDGEQEMQTLEVAMGSHFVLPEALAVSDDEVFVGWLVEGVRQDGLYAPGATVTVSADAITVCAQRMRLRTLSGAALRFEEDRVRLCFDGAIGGEEYDRLSSYATLTPLMLLCRGESDPAAASEKTEITAGEMVRSRGGNYYVMHGETDTITVYTRKMLWSAVAAVRVTYADGSERLLTGTYDAVYHTRCARDVAKVALSDTGAEYSEVWRALLAEYAR